MCQINFACFTNDCECEYLAVIEKIPVIMYLSLGDIITPDYQRQSVYAMAKQSSSIKYSRSLRIS